MPGVKQKEQQAKNFNPKFYCTLNVKVKTTEMFLKRRARQSLRFIYNLLWGDTYPNMPPPIILGIWGDTYPNMSPWDPKEGGKNPPRDNMSPGWGKKQSFPTPHMAVGIISYPGSNLVMGKTYIRDSLVSL